MNKPIEIEFTFLGKKHTAQFHKNTYVNNGNLYIGVLAWDEEYEYWEHWSDLTVNLSVPCKPNTAFIKTDCSGEEIIEALVKKGYATETGVMRCSGYCVYPMYEFTEEFLNGIDED